MPTEKCPTEKCLTVSFARRMFTHGALVLGALSLAGCIATSLPGVPGASVETPAPAANPNIIGTGRVKVALILPLSGTGGGVAAGQTLRNAAELAHSEFQNPDIQILVKDDGGTPDGARAAAQAALAEGAELIIGPLFAGSVQAVGQVARSANRPVIAFSTDVSVAARGVYLLSFLAETEVERIVAHAAANNRGSIVAMIPETPYGRVVEAALQQAVSVRGARLVALERYVASDRARLQAAAQRIAAAAGQANAVFIPDTPDNLPAVAQALQGAGMDLTRVKPLGTGAWNDPRALAVPALAGGWFAAPETAGYAAFAGRYRARFNAEPTRISTLSYDAVSLVAALVRTQGAQRFSDATLTNPSGFAGIDGVFRFRADGTNERGLAVYEVRGGQAAPVSPAPRALGSGT